MYECTQLIRVWTVRSASFWSYFSMECTQGRYCSNCCSIGHSWTSNITHKIACADDRAEHRFCGHPCHYSSEQILPKAQSCRGNLCWTGRESNWIRLRNIDRGGRQQSHRDYATSIFRSSKKEQAERNVGKCYLYGPRGVIDDTVLKVMRGIRDKKD